MAMRSVLRPLTVSDLRSVLAGLPGDRLVEVADETRTERRSVVGIRDDSRDAGTCVVRLHIR